MNKTLAELEAATEAANVAMKTALNAFDAVRRTGTDAECLVLKAALTKAERAYMKCITAEDKARKGTR